MSGHPIRQGAAGTLFEITTRTVQARYLLTPSAEVNDVVLGCLGRAQHLYGLKIHAFVYMSNHFHMLVSPGDARQLSRFMGHLNSNTTREVNRLVDWSGSMWNRRYRAVPVTGEDAAQINRLRYILAHGVKEGLVKRAADWPGVSCVSALVDGKPLFGTWVDRTAAYHASKRKHRTALAGEFETSYQVSLSPLPCWDDLPESQWRGNVSELIDALEADIAEERRREGMPERVLGVAAILEQDPHTRPANCDRTPAPMVHAASTSEKQRWQDEIKWVRCLHAAASARFRQGEHGVDFPTGTFRPLGSFVPLPDEPGRKLRGGKTRLEGASPPARAA